MAKWKLPLVAKLKSPALSGATSSPICAAPAGFATGGDTVARGFCLHLVEESLRHERILLLPSAALMEAHGIQISVTADPAFGDVERFVLGGLAIVANWIRTAGSVARGPRPPHPR